MVRSVPAEYWALLGFPWLVVAFSRSVIVHARAAEHAGVVVATGAIGAAAAEGAQQLVADAHHLPARRAPNRQGQGQHQVVVRAAAGPEGPAAAVRDGGAEIPQFGDQRRDLGEVALDQQPAVVKQGL